MKENCSQHEWRPAHGRSNSLNLFILDAGEDFFQEISGQQCDQNIKINLNVLFSRAFNYLEIPILNNSPIYLCNFVLRKNHYDEITVFPFLTCTLIKYLFDNLIDLYIYLYPYSMTVMEWEKKNLARSGIQVVFSMLASEPGAGNRIGLTHSSFPFCIRGGSWHQM